MKAVILAGGLGTRLRPENAFWMEDRLMNVPGGVII